MVVKRPILVGGLGLAASLGVLEVINSGLSGPWLTNALVVGAGVWWWRHRRQVPKSSPCVPTVVPVDRGRVLAALESLDALITTLETAAAAMENPAPWQGQGVEFRQGVEDLRQQLQRSHLRLAVVGAPGTGKTAVMQQLKVQPSPIQPSSIQPLQQEHQGNNSEDNSPPGMTVIEWNRGTRSAPTRSTPTRSAPEDGQDWHQTLVPQDGVLYLVNEDLTESARGDLVTLAAAGHGLALVLNKQDRYLPEELATVQRQLQARVDALTSAGNPVAVLSIAATPKAVKVRTHQADGTATERWETPDPVMAPLHQWIRQWQAQGSHWVVQTTYRQGEALRRQVQTSLNRLHRDRARPLVEQMQWGAGAIALASPLPTVDLLGAIAINGQLILDLGQIYQQPFSLEQAQTVAQELAGLVLKLGLVEASTQLLATTLKGHVATYWVGGAVQGLSAAYLTRMVAEGLMDYLEARALAGQTAAPLAPAAIAQAIQGWMQRIPQGEFLRGLMQQGQQHLLGGRGVPATPAALALASEQQSQP